MQPPLRPLPSGVLPLMPGDPEEVGRYRLLGRLGTGGMGLVYLGTAGDDDRLVAVKTLHASHSIDPEARRRFRDEAGYAGRIGSCCIARVVEDGSDRTRPFLVTEFIPGPPLSQVVEEEGPLSPEARHAVAIGVADALVAIHGAGVAHRDIKPSNVLLARDGPRVIDFGIAHPLDGSGGETQAGVVMGSPGWIAPERLTGGPSDAACDVFGWGLLVAYASTGRHPFGEGDGRQLAQRILALPPDLAGMGEPLRGLAEAALAKEPALRPDAEDLLSTLLEPRAEPTAALAVAELWTPPEPPTDAGVVPPPPPRRMRRRRSRLMTGWVTAAVSLGAGAFAGVYLGGGTENEAPRRIEVTVTTAVPVPQRPAASGSATPTPGASPLTSPRATGPKATRKPPHKPGGASKEKRRGRERRPPH
ncbi:serine/threonine-protein kinase [Thermomonospora umbrina]|uniref:Serine/threonine protein kinase n=1 Tax=Thermomonospora umbrina TaxID=111806 RepID=A0A3D9SQ29_9ACTN|nr:serine/threonine-protein kinase [Thermomonospora umbrina]REE96073.1 serine/threonine protein kinase [Thermomonospora umbrina]